MKSALRKIPGLLSHYCLGRFYYSTQTSRKAWPLVRRFFFDRDKYNSGLKKYIYIIFFFFCGWYKYVTLVLGQGNLLYQSWIEALLLASHLNTPRAAAMKIDHLTSDKPLHNSIPLTSSSSLICKFFFFHFTAMFAAKGS